MKKIIMFIMVLMLALIVAGCNKTPPINVNPSMTPTVTLDVTPTPLDITNISELNDTKDIWMMRTGDGIRIRGKFYEGGENAVLLLPMAGQDWESMEPLALELQKEGFSVLSLTPRGHGPINLFSGGYYRNFNEDQWHAILNDVLTSVHALQKKGYDVSIVGASIGANFALTYAATDPTIQKIVLISPGIEYRGINIEFPNKAYRGETLYLASSEDTYAYDSTKQLHEESLATKEFKEYTNAGHGSQMFERPEVMQDIVEWIKG